MWLLEKELCPGGTFSAQMSHVVSVHTGEDVNSNAVVDGQTGPFPIDLTVTCSSAMLFSPGRFNAVKPSNCMILKAH
jgi:hypothetical protein